MICNSCSSLAVTHKTKNCLMCNSFIYISLCKLCETCSSRDGKCAICMKNMKINKPISNCNSCGKK